ncbi:hypothetical protein LTR86_006589 [Recurvomyces mirabilis]|nr:hypothetical protein LTR86_006589 [Recurvomyces mirabilis]
MADEEVEAAVLGSPTLGEPVPLGVVLENEAKLEAVGGYELGAPIAGAEELVGAERVTEGPAEEELGDAGLLELPLGGVVEEEAGPLLEAGTAAEDEELGTVGTAGIAAEDEEPTLLGKVELLDAEAEAEAAPVEVAGMLDELGTGAGAEEDEATGALEAELLGGAWLKVYVEDQLVVVVEVTVLVIAVGPVGLAPAAELLVGGRRPVEGDVVALPIEVSVAGQMVVETGTMEVQVDVGQLTDAGQLKSVTMLVA